MGKFFVVSILFVASLTSSCVTTRPVIQEISLPPQRIAQNGYSIIPLHEAGWLIAYRDSGQFMLGKRGSDRNESVVIRAFVRPLPLLKSDEEFTGFAKLVLTAETPRHKMLSQQTKLVNVQSQSCVRIDSVMEDHGFVKQAARKDPMILEAFSLFCKHPNGSTGILIAYSHRFYEEHRDVESGKKAQKIFESIEFSSL